MNDSSIFDLGYLKKGKKKLEQAWRKESFCPDDLSYISLKNATLLSSKGWDNGKLTGGILDEEGSYIISSGYTCGGGTAYNPDNIIISEDTYIFIGYFNICWGHAITDNLSRLWFLKTDKCRYFLAKGAKIVYMTSFNSPLPEWHRELFKLANVDISKWLHITKCVKCKTIILPDLSLFLQNNSLRFTKEYRCVIDTIKQNIDIKSSCPEKLLFTRSAVDDSREWGEEKNIDELFRKKGFCVISPEKYSVKEQIQMLVHCKFFAAPEGSCSHNAVFCEPGTTVILLRKADYVNLYSIFIGQFAKVKSIYVDTNATIIIHRKTPMVGPFYTYPTFDLYKYLSIFPHHPIFLFLRKSYWKYIFMLAKIVLNTIFSRLK